MSPSFLSAPPEAAALPVGWTTEQPWMEVDESGCVTAVNTLFTALFGWRPDAIVGLPLVTIIPAQFRDAHNIGFSRFVEFGKPAILGQPIRLALVGGDGRTHAAEAVIQAERRGGRWRFGAQLQCIDQGA